MATRKNSIKLRQLTEQDNTPWSLLFYADPSKSAVSEYLARGTCYVAEKSGKILGCFVLMETRAKTYEIMNIAVLPSERSKGLGEKMVRRAKKIAKDNGGRRLEVGTGNSSFRQLAFYQRVGFRMTGVDRDFFKGRYNKVYKTQGVKLQDMVRFAMEL